MPTKILEIKPKRGETKPHPNYKVILLNDNHNSFEHVEECLIKHIPGMSMFKAHQLALTTHNQGLAVVWIGPREIAEHYYELLKSEGLTMTLEPEE